MKMIRSLAIVGALVLWIQGCGGLQPRTMIENSVPLYLNITKTEQGIKALSLNNQNGDINLQTLQATSPDVIAKYCEEADNYSCMDEILDQVEKAVDRKTILERFNGVIAQNEAHLKAMQTLYDTYAPSYKADQAHVSLDYRINDTSRLYKGEDIGMSQIVYVGLNSLEFPKEVTYQKEIDALFPLSIETFTQVMAKFYLDRQEKNRLSYATYDKTLRLLSSYYPIHQASQMKSGLFSLAVKAPQKVMRHEKKKVRVVIQVTGKDLSDIYPHKYVANNRDLELIFNKNSMIFNNKTRKNMNLQSVTLFYKEASYPVQLGENFLFSHINANQSASTEASLFMGATIKQAARFDQMTMARAAQEKVPFGVEVTYTLGQESKVQKLKNIQKIPVKKLLTGW